MSRTKDNGKWIFPGLVLAIITTLAIIAFAAQSNESSTGECQYANSFTDSSGQTWSATNIQATKTGCLEAIKIAVARAEQSVGLGPANLPLGWSCDSNSVCTKGDAEVTFDLAFES